MPGPATPYVTLFVGIVQIARDVVLLFGGIELPGYSVALTYKFNLTSEAWTMLPNMKVPAGGCG